MLGFLVVLLLQQDKPVPPKDESVLVKVADNAKLPSLALDIDGNAYVVFVRNGNIELSMSTDGGKTFSAPVTALDAKGRDIGIPNRGPRIAVDKGKRIYVSSPLNLAAPNMPVVNDLYFVVSSDKGKTFSKTFMINDAPGSATESAHNIAADATGLHASWVDTKKGHALLYAKYDPAGKRSGKLVTISGNCCENCPPGIAVDPAGNPTIAWRDAPKEPNAKVNRQVWLSRSTDGGKTFTASAQLNSLDTGLEECPQDAPATAASPDGKVLAAAWMERRDVERDADIFWAYGAPGKFGPDTCCQDDRRYQQRRPSLAVDADGVVWCAWEDSRWSTLHVFFTNHKIDGNVAVADPKTVPSSWPSLAAGGGRVAVAYQLGKDVVFRVLK